MLTFHKMKTTQEWVVKGPVSEMKLGVVTVQKQDQSTEQVEVMRLGKPFETGGEEYCYGYIYQQNSQQKKNRTPRANAYFAQLRRDEEAKKAGVQRWCDLCGEEAEGIGRDKNGKLGDLCEECGGIEEEERTFA